MSKSPASKSPSSPSSAESNGEEPISLYQNFLAMREEVLRHKWLRSEEAKEDIGFEAALMDWVNESTASEEAETGS